MHSFTAGCFKQDTRILDNNVDGIFRKADSPEECQKMCQNVTECVAFTYRGKLALVNPAYKMLCYFKSALPTKDNTKALKHHVTGPKFCGMYLRYIYQLLHFVDVAVSIY